MSASRWFAGMMLLLILLVAGCSSSTGESPPPSGSMDQGISNATVAEFDLTGLDLRPTSTGVEVNFTSPEPGFCNVLIGTRPGVYDRMMTESMPEGPHRDHFNTLDGLQADTEYYFVVVFTDANGQLSRSAEQSFRTTASDQTGGKEKAPGPTGQNVALLGEGASVTGVSSNFGGGGADGSWGGNRAIDGDPQTEWSSAGDGDGAWIEIALPSPKTIHTIGFQTRTMGTSAEIETFRVLLPDGTVLGPYSLTGPDQPDYFALSEPVTADRFRFEVVSSSGGNTGARSIQLLEP